MTRASPAGTAWRVGLSCGPDELDARPFASAYSLEELHDVASDIADEMLSRC
jgi:hypothetical protein